MTIIIIIIIIIVCSIVPYVVTSEVLVAGWISVEKVLG